MDRARSRHDVPIRLTEERWLHIVESHDDLAGYYDRVLETVEDPDYIVEGYGDALVALKGTRAGRYLAVVYKEETATDGFIITAYFTNKINLEKERIIWQRQ